MATLAQNGWYESKTYFKPLNLLSFWSNVCETISKRKIIYILFYIYSLGGMVLTGASISDCAHRDLAMNAPDWGLAHRFLAGIAIQGNEIFQVQFDVASSTATYYYGLWLSLVLTGNPYLRT